MPAYSTQHTLPYLATTEHLLPGREWQLAGNGIVFTERLRAATRAGGLWLVMQESNGKVADQPGQLVTHAAISQIDWLSGPQIRVQLRLTQWGVIHSSSRHAGSLYLSATVRPLWAAHLSLPDTHLLRQRFTQWQQAYALPELSATAHPASAAWLCWRWLELLPLTVATKQRLLHHPSPAVCLRYLEKIMRQGDLCSNLLR
ncbi:hypothetical protein [Photobacterium sp. TY1-4]|uniref:hypothetical protein n=1 Tax=Photobacterium sp. TY1-4 TaxID=2899122 RepID=UPI0021C115EB|nr:hypothetical protein [Photobacterium sp. TY1-4]UXI03531.1 hypothetical protein NH461_24230 [Photobacterium sp. TY1-4]